MSSPERFRGKHQLRKRRRLLQMLNRSPPLRAVLKQVRLHKSRKALPLPTRPKLPRPPPRHSSPPLLISHLRKARNLLPRPRDAGAGVKLRLNIRHNRAFVRSPPQSSPSPRIEDSFYAHPPPPLTPPLLTPPHR